MSENGVDDPKEIPKERDRKTGEDGDLGVWPENVEIAPAQVWDGDKAVFAYATHAHLGEYIERGEKLAVIFNDRAVVCEVKEIDMGESDE